MEGTGETNLNELSLQEVVQVWFIADHVELGKGLNGSLKQKFWSQFRQLVLMQLSGGTYVSAQLHLESGTILNGKSSPMLRLISPFDAQTLKNKSIVQTFTPKKVLFSSVITFTQNFGLCDYFFAPLYCDLYVSSLIYNLTGINLKEKEDNDLIGEFESL